MAQNRKNGIDRSWPSWILIFRLTKIQKWCQKWALYATSSRKSDIRRVSMTIYLKVTFSIWPQAAILNFDGWTGQNTKTDARNGFSMPNISRKSGITQLSISICFKVTFPIWPPAAILDFGFSQIPPPFSRGSWGLFFSKYFKELKSSVKPYYALSGHGTPRLHPTRYDEFCRVN